MTSRMVLNGEGHAFPGGLKEIIISCDGSGCTAQHNNAEIKDGGGLKSMGWLTKFDEDARVLKHYCPDHNIELNRAGREL